MVRDAQTYVPRHPAPNVRSIQSPYVASTLRPGHNVGNVPRALALTSRGFISPLYPRTPSLSPLCHSVSIFMSTMLTSCQSSCQRNPGTCPQVAGTQCRYRFCGRSNLAHSDGWVPGRGRWVGTDGYYSPHPGRCLVEGSGAEHPWSSLRLTWANSPV